MGQLAQVQAFPANAGGGKRRKRTRGGNGEAGPEKTTRVPPSTRPPTTHP